MKGESQRPRFTEVVTLLLSKGKKIAVPRTDVLLARDKLGKCGAVAPIAGIRALQNWNLEGASESSIFGPGSEKGRCHFHQKRPSWVE